MVPIALEAGKRRVLEDVAARLREVRNVVGIVLGGSQARGVAGPGSDLDIGIYYREAAPLVVADVRQVAESVCLEGTRPVVTELYGWGPWVNGGAWIQAAETKVDFVYRNVDQVKRVIEEGRQGVWRHDFDQQPPFGFRSVVYLGETHSCVALHDPEGVLGELKRAVAEYPAALQARIIGEGLWGAEFSLWAGGSYAAAGDVYNTAGCLTRAGQYMVQALFAMNEEYYLSDKHAGRVMGEFGRIPVGFGERMGRVLGRIGTEAGELSAAVEGMRELWGEVVELTAGAYEARFDLGVARGGTNKV